MSTLTLEEKVGQMMAVGFDALEAPPYILEWIAQGRVGSIVLFTRNVSTPEQLARLTTTLHQAAPADRPLLICIDQEGGLVARLHEGFTESPGAMALGAADSAALAERVAAVLATEMRALGINWNLAPVVDIIHNKNNPVIGTRSLGRDVERVAELAVAQIQGFQENGVATAVKHFPGHGNTPVDTHVELAVVTGPVDELFSHDLIPFRAAVEAGASAVMIGHVKFADIDPDHPSTLSRPVVQGILRDQIGFQGVAVSDCMEMQAITNHYGQGESAVLAALAGEDIILVSHTRSHQEAAYEAILEAARSGLLPMEQIDQSVKRILAMKQQFRFEGPAKPESIRMEESLQVMREAARAGTIMVRVEMGVLPIGGDERQVVVIEPRIVRQTLAEDEPQSSDLLKLVNQHLPQAATRVLFRDEALDEVLKQVEAADVLILATRNAHLDDMALERARTLLKAASHAVLLCLRNPFDAAALPEAGTALCVFSDSLPSLEAAVDALRGEFAPSGKLPVPLD
jgi:beta-N-acetylhexosaminidase